MNNKQQILVTVILLMAALVSCERAASTPEPPGDISSIFTMKETLTAQAPEAGSEDMADEETPDAGDQLDPFDPTSTSVPLVVTAAVTEGPTAAATVSETVPETYTLHQREYPYCIARRFDVDIDALLAASGLTGGSLYEEGLVLTIPQGAAPFGAERTLIPHPTQYTVQAGDTLYWISCKFGDVYPESIAQANGIGVDAGLTVGQVLQIP